VAAKKKKKFDAKREIRGIARERVGSVPPGRVILPKTERKPKHKKEPIEEVES